MKAISRRRDCSSTSFPLLLAALLSGVGVVPVLSQGGPPLVTEDPGTPGPGNWEINLAVEHEKVAGGRVSLVPVIDLNYGVGDRLQLKVETAWFLAQPDLNRSEDGLGSWEIGVKWRFYDGGPKRLKMSVYPQLELAGPGTDDQLYAESERLALPLQLAHCFGRYEVSAEAGYVVAERETNEWFAGVAAAVPLKPRAEILAELYTQKPERRSGGFVAFNVGFAFEMGSHLVLLASAGSTLTADAGSGPDLSVYLGVQVLR